MDDIHIYSLSDLIQAKSRELDRRLTASVSSMVGHVIECPVSADWLGLCMIDSSMARRSLLHRC